MKELTPTAMKKKGSLTNPCLGLNAIRQQTELGPTAKTISLTSVDFASLNLCNCTKGFLILWEGFVSLSRHFESGFRDLWRNVTERRDQLYPKIAWRHLSTSPPKRLARKTSPKWLRLFCVQWNVKP